MENSIERASKYTGAISSKNRPHRSINTGNNKRDFIIATLAAEFLNVGIRCFRDTFLF